MEKHCVFHDFGPGHATLAAILGVNAEKPLCFLHNFGPGRATLAAFLGVNDEKTICF